MVRDFLGNIKGQKGDPGEKGERGERGLPGENPLDGVNPNLLSLHTDDWFVGGINSTSGQRQAYASSLSTDYFVDIEPGEVYTLTLVSNHSSSTRLNWYQFTDGVYPGADGWSGAYPQNFTFTATGNNIKVRVYFGVDVTTDDLKDIYVKLERGSESTPHHDVLVGIDRKIKHHSRKNNPLMISSPYKQPVPGERTPLNLRTSLEYDDLTNPSNNEEIILSEGLWEFDFDFTMRSHADGDNCITRININGNLFKALKTESNHTTSISTKIVANEGDRLEITQQVPVGSNFQIDRTVTQYSRMSLYKIGGNV